MRKIFVAAMLCFVFVFYGYSQTLSTKDAKAIELYRSAINQFELRYYDKAEPLLLAALKRDNSFSEAYYLLAGVYVQTQNPDKAIATLKTCVDNVAHSTPWAYYKLAFEEFDNGYYTDAYTHLQLLEKSKSVLNSNQKAQSDKLKAQCEVAIELIQNPIHFKPTNMGAHINSEYDDYHPAITVDEELFICTALVPISGSKGMQEDIFYSFKQNSQWDPRRTFPAPITTANNEGAQSISADGSTLIFTACNLPGGKGSCDIYISYRDGAKWTTPINIGEPINTKYWESQPSLTADGRTLYFVSNRPGGFGKKDIWQSNLQDNGRWSQPVNVGATINSAEDDEAPFIHADGKTLFFSSNGHYGLGKKDIFISKKLANNAGWTKPVNMGYPANTHNDEGLVIVNAQATKGYFASNRYGTLGGLDIFEFEIDETFPLLPAPITYIKGVVHDYKILNKKIPALIELKDIHTRELFYKNYADRNTGEFTLPFEANKTYALTVTHKGYLLHSEHIQLSAIKETIDVGLQEVKIGNTIVLHNVFFDTDSYTLKPESEVELNTIIHYLKINSTIECEVSGHTDNIGKKEHNLLLSKNRAKAVYEYLIAGGIAPQRLHYNGYADNKPLTDNTTAKNRAKNRRTELVITKE